MTLPSSPREYSAEELYASPGDLTLLGLSVAARDTTLEGISRGAPELSAPGYDATHVALVEAFAVIAAQVAYRAERLPLAVLAAAFELLALPRRDAVASQVDVYVDNPSGSDVFWVEGSLVGAGATVFQVASTVVVPAGTVAYGPVPLVCMQRGPAGNIQARFPSWNLITTVPLEQIQNPQPGQGGAWAEGDAEYLARAGDRFAARGTGNRADDLLVIAEQVPGIQRALVVEHARLSAGARWSQFPWDGGTWGGPVYEAREGTVSVVARPYGGGYLSTALASRLSAALAYAEPAGVRVGVTSCEEVPVDIALRVVAEATHDTEVVRGAVKAALAAWLSPATWPWAGALTRAEIIAVAARVPGVRAVYPLALAPASEKEDSVDLGADRDGAIESIAPRYPHVLLAARDIAVTAGRS